MNMRILGVSVFASLFIAVGLLAGAAVLVYVRHASGSDGMQSVAAGFGLLAILVPMAIILGFLACFVVIFLAFRSRRR
jgi:ABC-type Na+ efflux pump permease subunit